jgi:hypothetical protein
MYRRLLLSYSVIMSELTQAFHLWMIYHKQTEKASKPPKNLAHYNEEINVDYKICNWLSCRTVEESLPRIILSIPKLQSILHLKYSFVIRNKSAFNYTK